MNELLMMEAALFQLRNATGDDPMLLSVRISAEMLARAVARAKEEGVNTARVNDIEFALNDLIVAIDDAGASNDVYLAVAMLQNDTASLRSKTALPAELTKSIRELQTKLKERARAMERSQYRMEGSEAAALPHDPEALRETAIPIVRQLAAAGFATPSLDLLIAEPGELRYHTINEIVDELDIILGG